MPGDVLNSPQELDLMGKMFVCSILTHLNHRSGSNKKLDANGKPEINPEGKK
jgi:hypothetical protein